MAFHCSPYDVSASAALTVGTPLPSKTTDPSAFAMMEVLPIVLAFDCLNKSFPCWCTFSIKRLFPKVLANCQLQPPSCTVHWEEVLLCLILLISHQLCTIEDRNMWLCYALSFVWYQTKTPILQAKCLRSQTGTPISSHSNSYTKCTNICIGSTPHPGTE